ncbi:hypothetical protein [Flavobacterium sp. J27]|uniref:hypothetical protein n=1 Tax=Flavobacterium sp. J27 TaxID=2060419 RepID=UPI001030C663|nr:hypothetical protein [Flavobacterium sp. J27]
MKKVVKKIFLFLSFLLLIVLAFYAISYYQQKNLYKKYNHTFNSKRKELGLQELSKDWISKSYNWNHWEELGYTNYYDFFFSKYIEIFKAENIPIGITYKEKNIDSTLIKEKYIDLNSNFLFWKNNILSETDFYEKYNDSTSYEMVSIQYYFEDDNHIRDYFKCDYYFIDTNTFICGTPRLMQEAKERKLKIPHQGNITKKQADSILKKWNFPQIKKD